MSSKYKYDNCVITGCDEKTAWQLEWFLANYSQNTSEPLIVADFGMSEATVNRIRFAPGVSGIMDLTDTPDQGWFNKPVTMMHAPAKKVIWLDTDCEVKSNLAPLFRLLEPNKLNMVEDKPWTKRRGEIWHNSGVVGFIDRPMILHQWCNAIREKPEVGDQEVLHSLLNPITRMTYINDLPFEWNVMRLATDHDGYKGKIRIQHHTGEKGNDKIRGLMQIRRAIVNG